MGEGSETEKVTVEALLIGGTLGVEMSVTLRINDGDDIKGFLPETLAIEGEDYRLRDSNPFITIGRSEDGRNA